MFRKCIGGDTELALVEHRHAQELFGLIEANRARLREWMSWVDQRRGQAEVSLYVATSLKQFAAGQGIHIGIWEKGKLCGMINCYPIDWPHRATYLEYWLGEPWQGKGLMTSASRAVLEYLFNELHLHRVTIRCAEENKRSRSVAERLGFTLEGISRDAEFLYDHFVNHAVYGLLKGDKGAAVKASGTSSQG